MIEGLLERLSEGTCSVTFTKVDGTERTMKCTKNFDLIPSDKVPSGTGTVAKQGVISVFDIEANGWRSFRPESVITWSKDV